jgi:transcriptional regulator with XRE-family HTH domain
MSQARLAVSLGVSRSAIANWEDSGPGGPGYASMARLAKVANVCLEWLATGRGEMDREPRSNDVPVARAILVETPDEVRMLSSYRAISSRARVALLCLAEEMATVRYGRKAKGRAEGFVGNGLELCAD